MSRLFFLNPKLLLAAVALAIPLCDGPLTNRGLAAPPEDVELEKFLGRLGLRDLRVMQLERMVAQESTTATKVELAKRLADLYADQLMAAADDAPRYEATLTKIQTLTRTVPQAQTASLTVILLQADYNRAESLMAKWIADPKQTDARDEAQRILANITPALMTRRKELTTQMDGLIKELDKLEEENRMFAQREQELARIQAVVGRASYFAAWSNYYLGLINQAGNSELTTGRDVFRGILGIEEKSYEDVYPEWLGLESIWRSRSLIGLGLTEAGLGDVNASKQCFDLLRHPSVGQEIQDQASYWYVRGLLNAGRSKEVLAFAKKEVAAFNTRPTQGKVSLCVALARAGYASPNPDAEREEMGRLGIAGLAKLGQQKAIGQLVEQLGISLENPEGFYLNWVKARQLADAAREKGESQQYAEAATAFEAALASPDAQANALSAAQCRYELGWCYYQLKRFEEAGRIYQEALIGLKAAKQATAPDAAWMAFVAYKELAATNRRFASVAIDLLQRLKTEFPNSKYARKADYFIAQMQRTSGSPAEAIRDLEAIPEDDPNYLAARYDLCVLLHQQWSEDKDNKGRNRQLQETIDGFVKIADDPRRALRALMLGTDAAIVTENWTLAGQRLAMASDHAAKISTPDSLLVEYHFRRLQLANHDSNAKSRDQEAKWIVENGEGTGYELPALVLTARALETDLKASEGADQAAIRDELIGVYRRLTNRYGTDVDVLKNNKNARVAASRLADYEQQSDLHENAAAILGKLLAAFPADASYLRRTGLAEFQAGRFKQSIERWRVLVRGLAKGKEPWCEAKYHQLACLAKIDRDAAATAMKQYRLLYPDYGDPAWRARFSELAKSLGL